MKLNLGCGGHKIEGLTNIDNRAEWNPDVLADVENLPYEKNSVDFIYAGHILEHFSYPDGQKALKEWKRVLKKGAELQVVVPNAKLFYERYATGHFSLGQLGWGLIGHDKEHPHPSDIHHCLYDPERLIEALVEAGFKNVIELDKSTNEYIQSDADWQILMRGEA